MAKTLNVAGAYHSRLMNSAFLQLGEALSATEINTPRFPVVCNVDAQPVRAADASRLRWFRPMRLDLYGRSGESPNSCE